MDAIPDLLPERLGDFEIIGTLGAGGSGHVYEARWGPRRVALKVLRAELLATDDTSARFFDEARLLAEIGHPGIVKILSYGTLDDGRPYLAMEFLEGEVLAAELARGELELADALELCDQLAGSLDAVHSQGLIHRDLKPENVLVAQTGPRSRHAVLLDFGIAKAIDAPASTTTQEGGVRGTPAYMAPERFFGQPASIASDVYELAVLFYSAVVGALPWGSGLDPEERLNPKRPSERGAALSPALETAMMRGLSTRPENRPESAGRFAAELREAAGIARRPAPRDDGERGVSARVTADLAKAPPSAQRPAQTPVTNPVALAPTESSSTARRRGRRRWPLAVAAGVAIAAGVGALLALRANRDEVELVTVDVYAIDSTRKTLKWGADRADEASPPRRAGDDSGLPGSVAHLASDTSVVVGMRVRELRQSAAFARIIDAEKKRDPLRAAVAATRACELDLVEDLDWITVGISGEQRDALDLIVAGNFDRTKIEGCLSEVGSAFLGSGFKAIDRGPITEMRGGGAPWHLLWLDERTLMVSSRTEADARWLAARKEAAESVVEDEVMGPAIKAVDRQATVWMVGRPDSLNAGTELQGVPIPDMLWGALEISNLIALEATMVFPDAQKAEEADAKLEAAFADLNKDPMAAALVRELSSEVSTERVILKFEVGELATQLLASALGDAIREGKL